MCSSASRWALSASSVSQRWPPSAKKATRPPMKAASRAIRTQLPLTAASCFIGKCPAMCACGASLLHIEPSTSIAWLGDASLPVTDCVSHFTVLVQAAAYASLRLDRECVRRTYNTTHQQTQQGLL